MSSLKARVLLIVAMVVASVWALYPRTVVERVKRNGVFVYDTIKRVPLKRGLDLQGGMHLALEIDDSRGAVANPAEALDRALKVVRTRIDEFGVSEPVVQKVGDDRIIVELAGIDDQQRATDLVQKSAFLQFQITDETQALEKSLPRLDNIVRERGLATTPTLGDTAQKSAVATGLEQLFTPGDSAKRAAGDTTANDSGSVLATTGGPFSKLIQQGQFSG